MADELRERLRRLPKAELHLHLEGSLAPATLWKLAQRHASPYGLVSPEACAAVYQFSDFSGFIQAIKTASLLLIDPDDYHLAVLELARSLAGQGVVYAEVFFSLGILHWKQAAVEPIWEALEAGRREAETQFGVRLGWLLDAVRQFGADAFARVVDGALSLRQLSDSILGIGLGGDERGGPAPIFERGFARARAAGLRLTAHAGETAGAQSVRDTFERLHAERIGHGLRAGDDPQLMAELADSTVFLDICTLSNRKTGCLPAGRRHPVRAFWEAGIAFSPSSDDPGIFGCELLDEYLLLHREYGFTWPELLALIRNSFRGSFLPPAEKARWLERVDAAAGA